MKAQEFTQCEASCEQWQLISDLSWWRFLSSETRAEKLRESKNEKLSVEMGESEGGEAYIGNLKPNEM